MLQYNVYNLKISSLKVLFFLGVVLVKRLLIPPIPKPKQGVGLC